MFFSKLFFKVYLRLYYINKLKIFRQMKSKNNVILDLDNTIICAVEKHDYNKTKFELLELRLFFPQVQ